MATRIEDPHISNDGSFWGFYEAEDWSTSSKTTLTRSGKAVEYEVYHKRPQDEVRNSLLKLNIAFDSLVLKDKELTSLSSDDNEFEKKEIWLTECENIF